MTHPKPDHRKAAYFPYFDWLRLVLAMTVALAHDGLQIDHNAPNFAVQVFFALSGWLIGGILLNSERKDLPRFYFNRAARIWIPYYFSVGLLFAVSLLKEPIDKEWLEYLFYDLTYTHNWFITPRIEEISANLPLDGTSNHYWSLAVEEQFYLFAPLLLIFTKWGRSLWVWAAIAALAMITKLWYAPIAFGVLAIIAHQRFGDWHLRRIAQLALGALLLICIGAYAAYGDLYAYAAPIASITIVLLLARTGAKSSIGAFVGGLSYPLYLNHWVGIFVVHEILQRIPALGEGGSIFLGGVLNFAFASMLFVTIDEQVRRRRSKVFSPARGGIAAAIAYGLVAVGGIGGLAIMALR